MSKALITEQTLTDIANNIRSNSTAGTMTPAEMSEKIKNMFPLDVFFNPKPFTTPKDEITIHLLAKWDNSYKLAYTGLSKTLKLIYDVNSTLEQTSGNQNYLLKNGQNYENVIVDVSQKQVGKTSFMFDQIDSLKKIIIIGADNNHIFSAGSYFASAYSTDIGRNSLEEVSGIHSGKYNGIGSSAFKNQTKLKDIFFKNNEGVSIGDNAFEEC